jgi:hypothetical protein
LNPQEVVLAKQLSLIRRLDALIYREISGLAPDIGQHLAAEQEAAAAFERAAKTILKRLPDALAYAGADEPSITGHISLPKRRPIPR